MRMYTYGPMKRKDADLYDYSILDGENARPIGYCNGAMAKEIKGFVDLPEDIRNKYHTGGHKTAEEACTCYKNYIIENHIGIVADGPLAVCHMCGKDEVSTVVLVGKRPMFTLCLDHDIEEFVKQNFNVEALLWTSELLGPI